MYIFLYLISVHISNHNVSALFQVIIDIVISMMRMKLHCSMARTLLIEGKFERAKERTEYISNR